MCAQVRARKEASQQRNSFESSPPVPHTLPRAAAPASPSPSRVAVPGSPAGFGGQGIMQGGLQGEVPGSSTLHPSAAPLHAAAHRQSPLRCAQATAPGAQPPLRSPGLLASPAFAAPATPAPATPAPAAAAPAAAVAAAPAASAVPVAPAAAAAAASVAARPPSGAPGMPLANPVVGIGDKEAASRLLASKQAQLAELQQKLEAQKRLQQQQQNQQNQQNQPAISPPGLLGTFGAAAQPALLPSVPPALTQLEQQTRMCEAEVVSCVGQAGPNPPVSASASERERQEGSLGASAELDAVAGIADDLLQQLRAEGIMS